VAAVARAQSTRNVHRTRTLASEDRPRRGASLRLASMSWIDLPLW
jgi:hypothetical protein